MSQIHVLDSETIDKIAAGEVIDRPSSVVKELVENAIDAGAAAITVEAKDGGIEFIRITDNGSGMAAGQVRTAFLRHATSKIESVDDLFQISSLGFRGEALSSIAAVAKVEVITKTEPALTGVRLCIEGTAEKSFEEVGAPNGTTFIIRNLFYNTPARRKFLKSPATEGGYIADLTEHLVLSRPDISFKFVLGNQIRFHTSGNGDLKEVIYRVYGRETAAQLVPVQVVRNGVQIEGYLGKPVLVRSNRNYEIYFVNGRFIKSKIIAGAIEEGYKEYLMQHKFPFCVLHIRMISSTVDVNVHPAKMDVRISDAPSFCDILTQAIRTSLMEREMIPDAELNDGQVVRQDTKMAGKESPSVPEPFEAARSGQYKVMEEVRYEAQQSKMQDILHNPSWNSHQLSKNAEKSESGVVGSEPALSHTQINLFEEKLLTVENRSRYRMIGQVFETYWMIQFEDKLFIIDQHAAHEKVKYERLMKQYHEHKVLSQSLMPPIIVTLSGQEEAILKNHQNAFLELGFEVEAFGGSEYALRSVPVDLYGCGERDMFLEVLDELAEGSLRSNLRVVEEKIASMSCKAAVKGNHCLSFAEAEKLIDELLTLDNPYNCPHGRPTIVSFSKMELEKKFKRIV